MDKPSKDNKKNTGDGEELEFDDVDIEPEESQAETLKNLRDKLKVCAAEKREYMEGWQRAKADLINARRRDEEDKKEFVKFANESLVAELLPALDSFEAALSDKDFWQKAPPQWRTGVENILAQLKAVLSGRGLEELSPLGEKFNPSVHTAAGSGKGEEGDSGVIIKVVQKGYALGGKMIRSPRVIVSE